MLTRFQSAFGVSFVAVLAMVAGCEKPQPPAAAKPAPAPAAAPATTSAPAAKPKMDEHPHGLPIDLGSVKIGAWDVKVNGEVEPGKEGHFDIVLSGSPDKPAAVRIWIGSQDARGAMKHKADGSDGTEYHAHADVPNPIPQDTKLWIEIEDAKGAKVAGGLPLKK